MKKIILYFSLTLLCVNCFSQYKREVIINPMIDTTSHHEFKEIFDFWQAYMNELNNQNIRNQYMIKEMNNELLSYWDLKESENHIFPDLYYSFSMSYGSVFYPMLKEYFLGYAKRDTDFFEIKTLFHFPEEFIIGGFPTFLITVPVVKIDGTYKLTNKLSINISKGKLNKSVYSDVTYYYSQHYKFNESKAIELQKDIQEFKNNFGIINSEPITYFVANNMTEIASWFGIDYFQFDFIGGSHMIEGRALASNNMVLSGGGGEDFLHEIIHILLKDYRKGRYALFEEGIASFFGGHFSNNDYTYQIGRLKVYLNENDWIDLSKSLVGYYKSIDNKYTYEIPEGEQHDDYTIYSYGDRETHFGYIIHAAICDIAFRMGGYETVKELFHCEANNEGEFYKCIEDVLSIKRSDLNDYIKDFIDSNY